jgi:hypothetical protein
MVFKHIFIYALIKPPPKEKIPKNKEMINNIFNDKCALIAVILAASTSIYGIIKLKRLNIKAPGNILTDEQSDLLVMGVFHVLIGAVAICCLL